MRLTIAVLLPILLHACNYAYWQMSVYPDHVIFEPIPTFETGPGTPLPSTPFVTATPTQLVTPTTTPQATVRVSVAGGLNARMRECGSLACQVISTASNGSIGIVLERESGWTRIRLPDNRTGWIRDDLLVFE